MKIITMIVRRGLAKTVSVAECIIFVAVLATQNKKMLVIPLL